MNSDNLFATGPDAETQWRRFEHLVQNRYSDFFDGEGPIVGARAPGRLDVMGGIADYSGSVVLEMPIANATCVAWQWRETPELRIRSLSVEGDGLAPEVIVPLSALVDENGQVRPAESVRAQLTADADTRWAAYIAGCFHVMLSAYNKAPTHLRDEVRIGTQGANILVWSDVPLGAGVSSSAALEVATMHALSAAAGIEPSDMTLAAWCQRAENTIVGAPCGIMDQVTCALGREDALIVLRCQPHDLLGTQKLPQGWRLLGIDSGVKHSVGGSAYTKARVGAFMGLKVIQLESGGKLLENYLCKMSPDEFARYRDQIPETLTGAEYHEQYGRLPDTITRVDPDATYHPRSCAEHPILENDRARKFSSIMQIASLRDEEARETVPEPGEDAVFGASSLEPSARETAQPDPDTISAAGRLMYEAHESYSTRVELGSPETDLLVNLIRERGPERGLYGAKITGGGAGGTVAVLCAANTPDVDAALTEVCDEYERQTGIKPRPIVGSSPGAVMFGARPILRG